LEGGGVSPLGGKKRKEKLRAGREPNPKKLKKKGH